MVRFFVVLILFIASVSQAAGPQFETPPMPVQIMGVPGPVRFAPGYHPAVVIPQIILPVSPFLPSAKPQQLIPATSFTWTRDGGFVPLDQSLIRR